MRHLTLPGGPLKIVCLAAHPGDIEIAAGALTSSPERCRGGSSGRGLPAGFATELSRLPDGRLPAHWNEIKDILHAFAAPYPPRMWFWHREWTTPTKIIDY
jgi:hypothetical protein